MLLVEFSRAITFCPLLNLHTAKENLKQQQQNTWFQNDLSDKAIENNLIN
jgi:hypothetical protein